MAGQASGEKLARLDAVGGEALGELVLDLLDERVVALPVGYPRSWEGGEGEGKG